MLDPTHPAPVSIRFEQAVYGSFSFWDKGYALLANSPGCRREWLADFQAVCRKYGERPQNAAEAGGLLALKIPSGPWMVVRPSPQGRDDRGRPGALAFHALFLSGSDYRKLGAVPFELKPLLRDDWTVETTSLPAGTFLVENPAPSGPTPPADPKVAAIVNALRQKRRVALEAVGPTDDLARQVWLALPARRRSQLSLATWTFALGNRHDLAALPKLAGIPLDRSYIDPFSLQTAATTIERTTPLRMRLAGRLIWVGFAIVAMTALGFAWTHRDQPQTSSTDLEPTGLRKIDEDLYAFTQRFETPKSSVGPSHTRAFALIPRLRERLAYKGPLLTPEELARLRRSPDPDRDRCLVWHDHILLFIPDCPLPPDFDSIPIARRLQVLAWSFHLDPADRPVDQIPRFLSEALAVPGPVRSTPLADRYPTLTEYARFLRRLPAR